MSEIRLGYFGDRRNGATGSELVEGMVRSGSAVVRKAAGGRAAEVRIGRWLGNAAVTVEEMAATAARRVGRAVAGRTILAIQDTTTITFRGQQAEYAGLGQANDKAPGFFIHPTIAVDAETDHLLGVAHAEIWTRGTGADAPDRSRRNQLPIEQKETHRWIQGAARAAETLAEAAQVIVVADREGDFYANFASRPATVDLLVRAMHDRSIVGGKLFAAAKAWPVADRRPITATPPRPAGMSKKQRRTPRHMEVEIRFGTVALRPPGSGNVKAAPEPIGLTLVDVREVNASPGRSPVRWRLLTTLAVATVEDAWQVVAHYRRRWRIEQVFRAMKSDGLGLDRTQVRDRHRLFNLSMAALVAAVRTIQLVDARSGGPRPASDVLDDEDRLDAAEAIGKSLEGKTERQKNPHPRRSLAWLSWIAARLGGWNCYYKPPGPKTMHCGWEHLSQRIEGYRLARADL